MIEIYHNPRCKKSREGLAILEESGKDFKIRKYLEDIPSQAELKTILSKLGIAPIELVRTQEKVWKDQFKGKSLSDAEIIDALNQFPKLIERPIVIHNDKAVVGRPPEAIKDIL
jgi:arsenate reductase